MRKVRPRSMIAVVATVVAMSTALLTALVPGTAGAAATGYVALGDSYSAGAGVSPTSTDISPVCLQSQINYPKLVAGDFGFQLSDVSCSAATTSDMTQSQFPGVPAQFDALSASTGVVTIGIGGNDNNLFISAIVECGLTDVLNILNMNGDPCEQQFGAGLEASVPADAPNIAAALQQIHQISPNAQVFVVGYPDILPQSGNCFSAIPIAVGDVAFLNGLEQSLNAMLASEAQANDATFVDTYTPSIGHDACQAAGTRWIEPAIGANGALIIHPNSLGEAADAQDVEAAMTSTGVG